MAAPLLGDGSSRALGALLFMQASTNAMDVYSALNSSPWTAENFGADPEKAASCMEYVMHSIAITSFFGVSSAVIAKSWWPVIGTALADGYMFWLYNRALQRGASSGSTGWGQQAAPAAGEAVFAVAA
jgi:hypothetical protein